MPIDFHAPANRYTYAGRTADDTWRGAMREIVDPAGLDVVDVGCGAGTYTRAWIELGAATVTGVDFSEEMLTAAQEASERGHGTRFVLGDATQTGLAPGAADVVFERALVHHVSDRHALAREARRLLRSDGVCIVQDRTIDDVAQAGSARHPRGLIFERFPRLLDVEAARRPRTGELEAALRDAGFTDVGTRALWEVRRVHEDREAFLEEIRARTGRSLLHELDDDELAALVDHLRARLPAGPALAEADRWTLWIAR
jgi:ubiquinone/menaquinone biosynthesis C-methylase UbiE